jgi:hypothetical protein
MGCGGCAARRAARAAEANITYKWTGPEKEDGTRDVVVYDTELKAKAKVMRKGGSYVPVQG